MADLDRIEREALKAYAREELKSNLKLSDEELQALDDKDEIIQYYGNFLTEMTLQHTRGHE